MDISFILIEIIKIDIFPIPAKICIVLVYDSFE